MDVSKRLLEALEKERQFAIKVKEPIMALGISQAIQVVEAFKETYFIAVIEEYWNGKETPLNTEMSHLFSSYRDASEWLIEEGLEVYGEYCDLFEEYGLEFSNNGDGIDDPIYVGYIKELQVMK